jgi:hypothetical protein
MKQLTLFSIALLLAACNNQTDKSASGVTQSPTEGVAETTTPLNNNGIGVAITVFAELQRGQGTMQGEYDSQGGMFVPCGATQGMPVQPGEVRKIAGACNGMPNKMEPDLMVVRRSGSQFNVVSRNVTLQDIESEKGKGEYQTTEGTTKQIILDPETTRRLKAEPKIQYKVQRK